MKRATPVQMRRSLEIVEELKKGGIHFVPVPVFDEGDFEDKMSELTGKLLILERIVTDEKKGKE